MIAGVVPAISCFLASALRNDVITLHHGIKHVPDTEYIPDEELTKT